METGNVCDPALTSNSILLESQNKLIGLGFSFAVGLDIVL